MRFGNVWHGDFRELADYGWEIAEANAGPPPQQLPQLSDVLAEAARGEVYFYQPDQVETVTVGGAVAVAFKQGDVIWAEVPESAFGGPYDFWHDVWETLEESCEIGLEDGYRAARGLLDPVE